MLTNYSGKLFAQSIKNWVLLSWSFQTVEYSPALFGLIMNWVGEILVLGSVENASLLPWFVMTALFHTLMVLETFLFLDNNSVYSYFYFKYYWDISS